MSLQRCQQETTSREFLEWQRFLDIELETPTKQDYYMAQIAAEVRRVLRKNPRTVKLEHFLLRFTTGREKTKPLTEDQIKQRTAYSKAKWFAITAMKPRKPPPQKE